MIWEQYCNWQSIMKNINETTMMTWLFSTQTCTAHIEYEIAKIANRKHCDVFIGVCGVRKLKGILPSNKTQYSPRAGGIECQLIIKIRSRNNSITDFFREAEQYHI